MCRLSLEVLIRVASCDDDWLMSEGGSPHIPTPMTEEQIKRNAVGQTQKQLSGKIVLVDYDPAWPRPAYLLESLKESPPP